jgi:hypothetical protein
MVTLAPAFERASRVFDTRFYLVDGNTTPLATVDHTEAGRCLASAAELVPTGEVRSSSQRAAIWNGWRCSVILTLLPRTRRRIRFPRS